MRRAAQAASCIATTLLAASLALATDSGYENIPLEGPNGSFLQGANLSNNSQSRLLDEGGHFKGKPKSIGRVVNPTDVLITAPNWTTQAAVKLYTSVPKLPDHVHAIHVLYYCTKDLKSAKFIGYAVLSPERKVTSVVRYDGPDKFEDNDSSAWISWLAKSLETLNPEPEKAKEKK